MAATTAALAPTGAGPTTAGARPAPDDRRPGLLLVAAGGAMAVVSPLAGAVLASTAIAVVLAAGRRRDAVTLVGGMFVLFVAIPTRFSFIGFGPLTPGMVIGTLAVLRWVAGHVGGDPRLDHGRQPIRVLMALLLAAAMVGFATMFSHATTDEQLVNAHRSPGILAMFAGVAVLVADGTPTRRRLDDLLEVLVLCGGALALCGLIEQVLGRRLFAGIVLPGLTENPSQLTITPRNGFMRVAGTAKHPIEFAVVLAALLPLALHLAVHGRRAFRHSAALLAVLMAVALPFAISRSGVIGAAIGCLFIAAGWSWRARLRALTGFAVVLATLALVAPPLTGTIADLFANVGDDTSISARTRDYDVLDDVLTETPLLGRGIGEYNVDDYEVFDNQYLAALVDGGLLGVLAVLATFVVPMLLLGPVVRRGSPADAHLARALMGSLACLGVTWAFFDGAGYRIATGLVFAVAGAAGALWRFARRDAEPAHAPTAAATRPAASGTVSVVVPAHDEAPVIERCLRRMLDGAEPGELDIVVVANGCRDDTAARARAVAPGTVRVLELGEGSKPAALNAGDRAATSFPRFYVDADVELGIDAIRATAAVLRGGRVLVAAPRVELDLDGSDTAVRAFYRSWARMPYVTEGHVGSGVYALSAAGRRRLGRGFPDLIADDLWVRNRFRPSERRTVEHVSFVQRPPRDLVSLVRVRTRHMLGNLEYGRRFPTEARDAARRDTRRDVRWWLALDDRASASVYVAVNAVAKRLAHRRLGVDHRWDRDVTARAGGV